MVNSHILVLCIAVVSHLFRGKFLVVHLFLIFDSPLIILLNSSQLLSDHIEAHHSDAIGWYCVSCGKMLPDNMALYRHRSYHHYPGKYQCVCCNFTAKVVIEVTNHFDKAHIFPTGQTSL